MVLLLLGSALQIGTYAAPMLAAFLLIPVLEEYGTRYALTLYVCVAILAVLFVPETELALFYVLVMGYYPVLRVKLNGVKSTLLRWVLKFAVFNAGTVLVYLLLFALLRARRAGRVAGRRHRDAGSTAGRGQPVVLAV